MTTTVVVDTNNLVVSTAKETELVVVNSEKIVVASIDNTKVITAGLMPASTISTITGSVDIDISELQDGGMLVYNASTKKWTATNLLEKQIFEAGQF